MPVNTTKVNASAPLLSLLRYSATLGQNPHWVQGAGGNISLKEGSTLWVKASGTWLADADTQNILLPVDLSHMHQQIVTGQFDATPRVLNDSVLKPSIETILHAVMPQPVVIHTHPVDALVYLVQQNGLTALTAALKNAFIPWNWAWVDYYKPGPQLGKAVRQALLEHPRADVIFLANHGVIVGGESAEAIAIIHNQLQIALSKIPRFFNLSMPMPCPSAFSALGYICIEDETIQALALDTVCQHYLADNWVLYPDHAVFLGPQAPIFTDLNHLMTYAKTRPLPELIIVPGLGVFVQPGLNHNKHAMLRCYTDVLLRIPEGAMLHPLPPTAINELINWDAEQYRRQIAR